MNQHAILFIALCLVQAQSTPLLRLPEEQVKLGSGDNPEPTPFTVQLKNVKNAEYFGVISIGTPPQEFRVQFNTGTADTRIQSIMCLNVFPGCQNHRSYSSWLSKTYTKNGTPFSIDLVFIEEKGFISQDVLNVAGISIPDQLFVEVVKKQGPIYDLVGFDGVLGLAYPEKSLSSVTSVFDNIMASKQLPSNIFSFFLNGNRLSPLGGELMLGGTNPDYYDGDLHYVSVTKKGYWQILVDRIQTDDGYTMCSEGCQAAVLTGTATINGPSKDIAAIHRIIGAFPLDGQKHSVDCRSVPRLPEITFYLGGKEFTLAGKDYILMERMEKGLVCLSTFMALDVTPGYSEWALGVPFIRRFYTVFDRDNDRVGFAPVKKPVKPPKPGAL
ncbi:cathepsin D-like isoform X2 [Denticeps clupeoides]|uniref:cathepsin D-like isoform X2 n=1 Tax=Denticeps clupeoides TaxID=299321 RepID=UPI0010A2C2B1|nr:cathepsin D-like isoform X2 [Denticeps clupeoides]